MRSQRKILVKPKRDPLFGLSRDAAICFMQSALSGRCQKAFVYGSFARDEMHSESDIDCVIITETDLPFIERTRMFEDLRTTLPSIEALVYTPAEFDRLTTDPSPCFWKSVVAELVRVV